MPKFVTVLVLVLTICPFTAPFRTYDPAPPTRPTLVDDDPGCIVAPVPTEARRAAVASPAESLSAAPPEALSRVGVVVASVAHDCAIDPKSVTVLRI